MREQRQRFNEAPCRRYVAAKIEAEHSARAARQQAFCERIVAMALEFRISHALHGRLREQEFDHLARVGDMPVHSQRQGFDALQELPRGFGMQTCSELRALT